MKKLIDDPKVGLGEIKGVAEEDPEKAQNMLKSTLEGLEKFQSLLGADFSDMIDELDSEEKTTEEIQEMADETFERIK